MLAAALGATPAYATAYNGQDPYASGCAASKWQVWPTRGETTQDGGLLVRDKTSVRAGTVYVYHSGNCQTAWAEWYSNTSSHWFHGELSIWNAWNQNQKSWTNAGTTWSRTKMIDDQVGVTSCVGMQVYYNGGWRRWDPGFCW